MMNLNNEVIITRGDSKVLELPIRLGNFFTDIYRLADNDALYFGLMDPGQPFEVALVRKKFTAADQQDNGTVAIAIQPEDTLDLIPGKYFYAVKLKVGPKAEDACVAEGVYTIINKTKFIIID